MNSITDALCYCFVCDWAGTVYDCLPDVDGDGSLGCPCCKSVITEDETYWPEMNE